MRRIFGLGCVGLVLFAFILSLGVSAWGPPWQSSAPMITAAIAASPGTSQPSPPAAGVSKELCLDCHVSFDELAQSTAGYVAPSGEKGTPHRYVPHEKKDLSAIPGCSNCHQPHPMPPPSPMELPKASVDWCFGACHHENNFKSCKECHL